jgi:hypothetical protein
MTGSFYPFWTSPHPRKKNMISNCISRKSNLPLKPCEKDFTGLLEEYMVAML